MFVQTQFGKIYWKVLKINCRFLQNKPKARIKRDPDDEYWIPIKSTKAATNRQYQHHDDENRSVANAMCATDKQAAILHRKNGQQKQYQERIPK